MFREDLQVTQHLTYQSKIWELKYVNSKNVQSNY